MYRMYKYIVCLKDTGERVFVGTSSECAEFLGYKDISSISDYFTKQRGTAKKKYIIKRVNDTNEINRKNSEVLDKFYKDFKRSPRKNEFIAYGGDYLGAMRQGKREYTAFLELNGYEHASRFKTVEAWDENNNYLGFGTCKMMSDKIGYSEITIRNLIAKNKRSKEGFLFKYKEVKELKNE